MIRIDMLMIETDNTIIELSGLANRLSPKVSDLQCEWSPVTSVSCNAFNFQHTDL